MVIVDFMKIRAVIFDLDDTLWDVSRFASAARRGAVQAMMRAGLKKYASKKRVWVLLQKIIERFGPNYQHHFDELCRAVVGRVEPKVVAAGIAAYHKQKARMGLFPEIKNVLAKLRKRKIKLYIATDGLAVKQWDKLVRLGLEDAFDRVFVSEEEGVEKEGGLFSRILKKEGLRAQEVLVVGDHYVRDFLAAKKAGIRALLLRRGAKKRAKNTIRNLREVLEYVG